jgi:hypothetical protein
VDLSLTLTPETPWRCGGVGALPLDYVPGRVLRAAFARAISRACPYHDAQGRAYDGEPRRFWPRYVGGAACSACPWRTWCQALDAVRFGDARPGGAGPVPRTVLQCKACPDEHPWVDDLPRRLKLQRAGEGAEPGDLAPGSCRSCGARLETAQPRSVPRLWERLQVGLDARRWAARHGVLFATAAREAGCALRALLRVPDGLGDDWSVPGGLLWVGARTSVGLGRMVVEVAPAGAPAGPSLSERLVAFRHLVDPGGPWWAPVVLEADALLPEGPPRPAAGEPTEASLRWLEDRLGLAVGGWRLCRADADVEVRRGWDTSVPGGARRPLRAYLLRGSVLTLSREAEPDAEAWRALERLEAEGIGEGTRDGLGAVRVGPPWGEGGGAR